MSECFVASADYPNALSIIPVTSETLEGVISSPWIRTFLTLQGFQAKPGQICLVPDRETSELMQVLVGVDPKKSLYSLAGLPAKLPEGQYYLEDQDALLDEPQAFLGFGLGCYQFARYKKVTSIKAQLCVESHDLARLKEVVKAIHWMRDLINTPAEDMGPDALAEEAIQFCREVGAQCQVTVGDALLETNYPTIHMVGRAASNPPRLIDIRWGEVDHPKVTLVGKGVCFDTGGLNIKNDTGMLLMKKDMGGASHVLGLARLIIEYQLPVRLRVLIPAVENSISGNAYRPGDVVITRKGLSVEVIDTDAEGRLILCDALAEASSEHPELIMDFATLTGAAKVALGTELPALYSNRPEVAQRMMALGQAQEDPVWHMPLVSDYRELLDSNIADISNLGKGSWAGSITAALFLQEFVEPGSDWVHMDIMAWNAKAKPGRPEGGEATGMRTAFAYLQERYGC